jgi:ABC-type bacteriocin/lantibiotic exporter with double-glycine peptidase domain
LNIEKNSFRHNIGTLLPQDQFVNATIFENIAFGRAEVDLKIVSQISTKLDMSQFIDQITEKYNAVINPERNMLPNDISTKILLARALVSNPAILLLEDPTSGFNPKQTTFISNYLKGINNSTILMASFEDEIHRISDRIIEIKEGKIIFEGTYAEYQKRK